MCVEYIGLLIAYMVNLSVLLFVVYTVKCFVSFACLIYWSATYLYGQVKFPCYLVVYIAKFVVVFVCLIYMVTNYSYG